MNRGIYFIGGASASGKSTCAAMLASEPGIGCIELDGFYNVLRHGVTDEPTLAQITRTVIRQGLDSLLAAGVHPILEGGWIDPERAAEIARGHERRFQPVFCGYPHAQAAARLELIARRGTHWLTQRDRQTALDWLGQQIEGSRWYEVECRKHGLPFFDFSDMDNGSRMLSAHYKAWRAQGGAQA